MKTISGLKNKILLADKQSFSLNTASSCFFYAFKSKKVDLSLHNSQIIPSNEMHNSSECQIELRRLTNWTEERIILELILITRSNYSLQLSKLWDNGISQSNRDKPQSQTMMSRFTDHQYHKENKLKRITTSKYTDVGAEHQVVHKTWRRNADGNDESAYTSNGIPIFEPCASGGWDSVNYIQIWYANKNPKQTKRWQQNTPRKWWNVLQLFQNVGHRITKRMQTYPHFLKLCLKRMETTFQ